jgi:hypothetical protein
MKQFNLGKGHAKGQSEQEASFQHGPDAWRKRFIPISLTVIILVSAAWVANTFIVIPSSPTPSQLQPVQAVSPPQPQTPPVFPPAPPPQEVAQKEEPAEKPLGKKPKAEGPKVEPLEEAKPKEANRKELKKKVRPLSSVKPQSAYSLQVGAMAEEENTKALKRQLEQLGYPARIRKGSLLVTKHIVYTGGSPSEEETQGLARKLNVDGFPSQVVLAGDHFFVQVGTFFDLNGAIDLAHELQKRNYPPKIVSSQVNTTIYRVQIGPFKSLAEALRTRKELKEKGLNSFIVKD